jgi:hypothetical protein
VEEVAGIAKQKIKNCSNSTPPSKKIKLIIDHINDNQKLDPGIIKEIITILEQYSENRSYERILSTSM